MKMVAVIPARGGSKGVPRKNLRIIAGKPLVAWSIDGALALGDRLHRVVVSTDDDEIAAVAVAAGAEAPFRRPVELSGDAAATLPVLQHATAFVEQQEGSKVDAVLLLQPTSPLRTVEDVAAALSLIEEGTADSVVSVVPVVQAHPMLLKTIENGLVVPFDRRFPEGARRQDLAPEVYTTNGAIYITRRDVLMKQGRILGDRTLPYVMPECRSLDIDTEFDLRVADMALADRAAAR